MRKAECFEFVKWVVFNYRFVEGLGYMEKGGRISTTTNFMGIDELFELWKSK